MTQKNTFDVTRNVRVLMEFLQTDTPQSIKGTFRRGLRDYAKHYPDLYCMMIEDHPDFVDYDKS